MQTLDVVDAMVPPKFVKPINAVEAKKGGSAHFVVEFDGSPQPDVTWFREGHAIQSSNDFQIVQVRVSVLNPTQFSLPPSPVSVFHNTTVPHQIVVSARYP